MSRHAQQCIVTLGPTLQLTAVDSAAAASESWLRPVFLISVHLCLSVFLSVCHSLLIFHLPALLAVCLPCPSLCLSFCLFICLSLYIYVSMSVMPLPACLSVPMLS